jgi:hypothetical protein
LTSTGENGTIFHITTKTKEQKIMSFTYRGLKATLDRHIVTGEEVDRQIERLRQQNPRIAHVDNRPT